MSTPHPQFCSEQLQSTVDSSALVFKGLEESRTRVSNDIKKLEKYLELQGVNEPFHFPLGKYYCKPEHMSEPEVQFSLDECGMVTGQIEEEVLAWAADDSGRFRLTFQLNAWQGHAGDVGPGGLIWDESSLVSKSKPLIETKFEIRKRMFPKLPQFVAAFGKHLTVESTLESTEPPGGSPTVPDGDDLPF